MAQMEKYLFETSFDVEPPPPTPAEETPEPAVYSAEELTAAQDESFAKGKTEGYESARQDIEQATGQALGAIAARLEATAAELAEVNERHLRQSLQAAVTILRKLFPELARRHGLGEIEAAIAACLERLRDEPRVVIRTADALVDLLCERIDPLAESCGFEGKIVLLSDPALASGDVRVEWADGGAERDGERLWAEVDQILADSLAPLPAEAAPAAGRAPPEHPVVDDDAVAETLAEAPATEDTATEDTATEDSGIAETATLTGPSETGAQP